jgi:antitoxin (DNA-binding transcriptional repressor) of toxin-antitoxin stability system
MATRTISQRELRNDSAKIIRELQGGTTFVLTNNGEPVGEIRPLHGPQRFVRKEVLVASIGDWKPIDVEEFMRDVDEAVDQTIYDPYTDEPI